MISEGKESTSGMQEDMSGGADGIWNGRSPADVVSFVMLVTTVTLPCDPLE